jgi:hypothetical protein
VFGRAAAEEQGDLDLMALQWLQKDAILEDLRPLVQQAERPVRGSS